MIYMKEYLRTYDGHDNDNHDYDDGDNDNHDDDDHDYDVNNDDDDCIIKNQSYLKTNFKNKLFQLQ